MKYDHICFSTKNIFWLALFLLFFPFSTDFSCCPPKVKLPCFSTRHSQPLNTACECLWAYKCAPRGKEKVKLSYWIDWTFMKLKCALPPASSHVEMTSRHLQRPVWNTAVRIPTFSQVLSCCPAGTIQLLNLLWVEQEGSFYRLQP